MNINDLTQYFDNPALSGFSRKTKKGTTVKIGKMLPLNWEFLNFGNSIKGTSYHSLRLAPMVAPNFSDLQVQEHSCIVPLRVIMDNYESTFNYAKNKDGAVLPHLTPTQYHDVLRSMLNNGLSPIGSLLDYLGYPVYGDLFDSLSDINFIYNTDIFSPYDPISYNEWTTRLADDTDITISFKYRDTNFTDFYTYSNYAFKDIIQWLATFRRPTPNLYESIYLFYWELYQYHGINFYDNPEKIFTLEEILPISGFTTVASLIQAYQSYLFGIVLDIYLKNVEIPEDAPNYTTLPLRAYQRFHIDWNTNGNFVDRDLEIQQRVYEFEDALIRVASGAPSELAKSTFERLLFPTDRLWRQDFWTSQLPTSAVDNAIEIPANTTVLNLASLSAFQKLVLKLSYSSRYRDVVWNLFKITPSDARLQQSSVIDRRYHSVGIGETIQTSESSPTSVLGNFAGRGYSAGENKTYHLLVEEPCIFFNMFSLISYASYADALHPNIHLDDIFDIPIPDMDVLGNQPIYADLISGNVTDSTEVFGYGRQYQEFLSQYDTVHGDFKTSLQYWQLTRRFGSTPRLNEQFLRMDSRDDFDLIFSVPDAPHAFASVLYLNNVTRHVHRNVRILI